MAAGRKVELGAGMRPKRGASGRRSAKGAGEAAPGLSGTSFIDIYRADAAQRIGMIRRGVPAQQCKQIVARLSGDSQRGLIEALHLSTATINRKAAKDEPLSADEGERVVGLARLVGQVQAIVEESGEPAGFDALAWLSRWLREPLPSLGGQRPIDLLDTMEGQSLVSSALARIQSGAYG